MSQIKVKKIPSSVVDNPPANEATLYYDIIENKLMTKEDDGNTYPVDGIRRVKIELTTNQINNGFTVPILVATPSDPSRFLQLIGGTARYIAGNQAFNAGANVNIVDIDGIQHATAPLLIQTTNSGNAPFLVFGFGAVSEQDLNKDFYVQIDADSSSGNGSAVIYLFFLETSI